MKRKFEQEFKKQAYNAVPDRWEEVKEKAGVSAPEKKAGKVMRLNAKAIASVAASITIVIVAVSVAVGIGSRKNAPAKSEITVTGENGITYTVTDVSDFDSIAVPETTVISYKDNNGVEHTTVATITRNAQGQREDSSIVVTFKDAQGNTQTTVVEIPAEPSATKPNGQSSTTKSASADSATQAADATVVLTTRAEIAKEVDWAERTMPEKFPAVQFDPTGIPGGLAKEYDFALRGNEYISRPATLLYKNYTLYNTNPRTDKEESTTADVYVFQNFSRRLAVGVKFPGEEKIHPYVNVQYTPQTLGDFLNDADVKNTVHFGNIRLFKDGTFPVNDQNKADIFRYLLSDGSIRNTNSTDRPSGAKVTLSVDLAELGKRTKVMEVYESGYVYTNLLGYGCTFNVGKENVAAFLKNSYNVTFDDLAKVGTTLQTTLPDCGGDPPVTTVSQPYFVEGTTVMTTQPRTVPE
ncbi:MAG: hypothetical protein IKW76_01080 [Clostridia bacterium]|nr:hypothetical protein [Clostridia bacterium]